MFPLFMFKFIKLETVQKTDKYWIDQIWQSIFGKYKYSYSIMDLALLKQARGLMTFSIYVILISASFFHFLLQGWTYFPATWLA